MSDGEKKQKQTNKEKKADGIKQLYRISIAPGLQYDCMAMPAMSLSEGDEVVVQCDNYRDYGVIASISGETGSEKELEQRCRHSGKGRKVEGRRLPRIIRKANLRDQSVAHENEARVKSLYKTAVSKAASYKLPMKLVNGHISFDRKYVFFQFSSEERVDFREFLDDLSRTFNLKVELRQIGVRDEAAMQGGIGICGRPFCCVSFLRQFTNINVKMAKTQNLSLSPSTVSGACGRLKCCLRYEYSGYQELRKELPKPGTRCDTPRGSGKVKDIHLLKKKVWVALDEGEGQAAEFENNEITPLREQS